MTRLARTVDTAMLGAVLAIAVVRWLGWRTVVGCVWPRR